VIFLKIKKNKSGRGACPRSPDQRGQAPLPDLFFLIFKKITQHQPRYIFLHHRSEVASLYSRSSGMKKY
ncbi:MAG TPA: hypothetical protein VF290_10920, partial [Pyrinomonadaceae bacterium]